MLRATQNPKAIKRVRHMIIFALSERSAAELAGEPPLSRPFPGSVGEVSTGGKIIPLAGPVKIARVTVHGLPAESRRLPTNGVTHLCILCKGEGLQRKKGAVRTSCPRPSPRDRSEERRVGKEGRGWWA